jgi:hypothetical protein
MVTIFAIKIAIGVSTRDPGQRRQISPLYARGFGRPPNALAWESGVVDCFIFFEFEPIRPSHGTCMNIH